MLKQRFFKSITLSVVMLMLLSSIVRAQERSISVCGNFNYQTIGSVTSVTFEDNGLNRIEIHHDYAPHESFIPPHWKKGRTEQWPVAYVAGTKAKLSAEFKLTCIVNGGSSSGIFAKGIGPNGIVFPAKELRITGGGDIGLYESALADLAFTSGTVNYFNPFEIQWQLSRKVNGTYESAGISQNPLYVPLSKLNGCKLNDDNNYYSVIHYACEPAKGLSDPNLILKAVWSNFENLDLPRIDKPSITALKYWGTRNPLYNQACRFIDGLLDIEDANCGEWASFMKHCLAFHSGSLTQLKGCTGEILAHEIISVETEFDNSYRLEFETMPPVKRHVFLVKNWNIPQLKNFYYVGRKHMSFTGTKVPFPSLSYYTNFTGYPIITNIGNIVDRGDMIGDKAHGILDPEPYFADHAVVCMPNGEIYDPSYGTGPFPNIKIWEEKSIDGYAIETKTLTKLGIFQTYSKLLYTFF